MQIEAYDTLRQMVNAHAQSADPFWYMKFWQGVSIRHPGLPGQTLDLPSEEVMAQLLDQRCVQIREHRNNGYTFVLTQNAFDRAASPS